MKDEQIINSCIIFVKETLKNAEGGHDWWHIERVWKTAITISKNETNINKLIIELGALLHDIADSKFNGGNEEIGPLKAEEFLKSINIDTKTITHIKNIIHNISFKGGNTKQEFHSPELDIIQDADRLDAIGAIGIARCFNYGGYKNREIYNPNIKVDMNMSKEQYKNSTAPSLNHFYEKLLSLKDKMNTKKGKQMAEKRHLFMEEYLNNFYNEWEGLQ